MCVLDNDDPIIIKFTVDDIHNTLYFSINDTQFPLDKGPEGTLEIISTHLTKYKRDGVWCLMEIPKHMHDICCAIAQIIDTA